MSGDGPNELNAVADDDAAAAISRPERTPLNAAADDDAETRTTRPLALADDAAERPDRAAT